MNKSNITEAVILAGGLGTRLANKLGAYSFEKDILEAYVSNEKWSYHIFDDYFIDIGVPEDYFKAQDDFFQFYFIN